MIALYWLFLTAHTSTHTLHHLSLHDLTLQDIPVHLVVP